MSQIFKSTTSHQTFIPLHMDIHHLLLRLLANSIDCKLYRLRLDKESRSRGPAVILHFDRHLAETQPQLEIYIHRYVIHE